jgi:hypothetical protein
MTSNSGHFEASGHRSSRGARAEAIAVKGLGVARIVGGTQANDVSATMRCRVRWPIRLMAGLLST